MQEKLSHLRVFLDTGPGGLKPNASAWERVIGSGIAPKRNEAAGFSFPAGLVLVSALWPLNYKLLHLPENAVGLGDP